MILRIRPREGNGVYEATELNVPYWEKYKDGINPEEADQALLSSINAEYRRRRITDRIEADEAARKAVHELGLHKPITLSVAWW